MVDIMRVIERAEWSDNPVEWKGEVQGSTHGSDISLIFNYQQELGGGPRLHRHPYPETFIIRSGAAIFTVAGRSIRATAGQIVFVPAHTPHKFANAGPDALETTDIHESGQFITEWLE
jgi:mannose-6-phosphate isomerase-like protein (cupin superfamily)